MNYSPQASLSVEFSIQARILEWIAISYSRLQDYVSIENRSPGVVKEGSDSSEKRECTEPLKKRKHIPSKELKNKSIQQIFSGNIWTIKLSAKELMVLNCGIGEHS